MPTAVIVANVTGSLDQEDRRAMLFVVEAENARRAALDPPGEPLPISTNVEIRQSYAVVQSHCSRQHTCLMSSNQMWQHFKI